MVQLPMDQRDRREDVEGVLLGHVPFELRVVGQGVAYRAVEALEQADEAPLDAWYYASRFAGKEAVSKALGTGMAGDVTVHTIEILRLPSGAPTVNVIGGAREVADEIGVTQCFISITYSGGLAIASTNLRYFTTAVGAFFSGLPRFAGGVRCRSSGRDRKSVV